MSQRALLVIATILSCGTFLRYKERHWKTGLQGSSLWKKSKHAKTTKRFDSLQFCVKWLGVEVVPYGPLADNSRTTYHSCLGHSSLSECSLAVSPR